MVYQIEISSKFPRELELVINLLWPIDYDEFWQKQNHRMDIEQKNVFILSQNMSFSFGTRISCPQRMLLNLSSCLPFKYILFFLTASLAK